LCSSGSCSTSRGSLAAIDPGGKRRKRLVLRGGVARQSLDHLAPAERLAKPGRCGDARRRTAHTFRGPGRKCARGVLWSGNGCRQALAVEATDSHHRLSSHRCRWREERDEAALALALKNLALASKEPGRSKPVPPTSEKGPCMGPFFQRAFGFRAWRSRR
jgi:hypothetical protein